MNSKRPINSSPVVYLDHAASTPLFDDIAERYATLAVDCFANSAAVHRQGYAVRCQIEQCQTQLLAALNIPPSTATVVWTSGGTESNNLAILGGTACLPPSRRAVVGTVVEHPSVLAPIDVLTTRGWPTSLLDVGRDGAIQLESLTAIIGADTGLVSIGHVQSETGVIQDLVAVRQQLDSQSCRAILHVDATQSAGKIDVPWSEARIDLLTLSSHKIHGPGGVGALIVRQGVSITPQIHGGGQQNNQRSGSLDACGITAFTMALKKCAECRKAASVFNLNAHLRDRVEQIVDRRGRPLNLLWNSPPDASPFIVNFSLIGYEGAVVARLLSEEGVSVGTGSACSAESKKPSAALTAMRRSRADAYGALRVSFGYTTTCADVDRFCDALQTVLNNY